MTIPRRRSTTPGVAFCSKLGAGLGWLTAAELLGDAGVGAARRLPRGASPSAAACCTAPHFPPTAKRVIYMHMLGAVSQVDTFDYKPMLEKMHGAGAARIGARQPRGCRRWSQGQTSFPVVGPMAKFQPGGKSGAMISDLMPYTREDRRRPLHHPDDAHRAREPRPGVEVPAHRLPDRRPPVGAAPGSTTRSARTTRTCRRSS